MTTDGSRAVSSVLVVDDDPVLRELFDAVLKDAGVATVLRASDGNVAHAILAGRQDVDFITLDLNMPGCDGIGFLRLASQLGYAGRLILVSSETPAIRESAEKLARMLGLNCVAVLPKPVDFARLSALLQTGAGDTRQAPVNIDLSMVRDGLEGGRLFPVYQPRMDIQCNRLAGAEALARIRDADGNILNTEKAVALAEEHGLISGLTWEMARLICADYGELRGAADHELHISFNISGAVLTEAGFSNRLAELVRSHDLEPRSFILEITETLLPSDKSLALEELTRARMMGFGIAVDDFGTGHSNIERVRQYPFSELKIDKSFLLNAEKDRFSRAAVEAGAALGRELGLLVVAEGVETIEGLELARSYGVNEGQGYLFSKPLTAKDFISQASLFARSASASEKEANASAA